MKNDNTYASKLQPVTAKNANEAQLEVLEYTKKKMGFIPNLQKNMAHNIGLQKVYNYSAEIFREESGFSPIEIETVYITVSFENNCDYCVAAHSMLGSVKAKMPSDVVEALRKGKEIPDFKLNTLHNFTKHMLLTRGWPDKSEVQKFLDAGYTEKHILSIIHAIATKTLSNYTNHIFHTELDAPLKVWEWKPLRKVVSFFKR
ncbi:carboxymuconolactone decarboxylase family protein [Aquimarina algicola]|uniref:Carboxymuconolactone decarboxylase family protein n=1 Tax=Aquimarina algicola TaxID=2589995 RepID=A0A504JEY4_9FLAO|nr:carboxymuconolactone decarboxylase family protein [Aquimarina algicola]TPN87015.1 carboxymuconolactone decarboxylase family protein [Aquimarina algicola]